MFVALCEWSIHTAMSSFAVATGYLKETRIVMFVVVEIVVITEVTGSIFI